jgi:hypothetical protein
MLTKIQSWEREQMFTMKILLVGHLYWVMILFKSFKQKTVKEVSSEFQKFDVNVRESHALCDIITDYHKFDTVQHIKIDYYLKLLAYIPFTASNIFL